MLNTPSLKLALLSDFREENWTSMDLAAEMLFSELSGQGVPVQRIQPRMARLGQRLPLPERLQKHAFNFDRGVGRYLQYPAATLPLRHQFDAFHIADHSYAHLALMLPAHRTGVYVHDIDAIRPALERGAASWRRAIARGLWAGLRRARVVFYSTDAVRREILKHAIVAEPRLVQAPLGVAAEFTPSAEPTSARVPVILHVGTVVPRKNPCFLLNVVAQVRTHVPNVRLLQVGGTWLPQHLELIRRLGLESAVSQVRGIPRAELAEHYRRAAVVVIPSLAEGFGIPAAEALGCGAVVVASDIPALREVAGDAAIFCPVSDLDRWATQVIGVLRGAPVPPREVRLARASHFSWCNHAATIAATYARLLGVAHLSGNRGPDAAQPGEEVSVHGPLSALSNDRR